MQTQQPPPTSDAGEPRNSCPSCGRRVDREQPFCIECGRRIAHDYRRPPNWRIPIALTALLVVLLGIAAGFGITELTDQYEGPETITVRTGPGGTTVVDPGEAPPTAAPTPPAAQPPATATPDAPPPGQQPPAQPPAQPTQPPRAPIAWPAGKEAYTVVLRTTKDRRAADELAQRAARAGEPAGVLDSGGYQRFEPGLFVVFAGQFDSEDAATDGAKRLGGDYPGAYPRYIEPK